MWRTAATVILAALLLGSAVLWVAIDVGPRGPVLVYISGDHGVDARDLLIAFPIVLAAVLLAGASRRSRAR